jgi:hypothetical protein
MSYVLMYIQCNNRILDTIETAHLFTCLKGDVRPGSTPLTVFGAEHIYEGAAICAM